MALVPPRPKLAQFWLAKGVALAGVSPRLFRGSACSRQLFLWVLLPLQLRPLWLQGIYRSFLILSKRHSQGQRSRTCWINGGWRSGHVSSWAACQINWYKSSCSYSSIWRPHLLLQASCRQNKFSISVKRANPWFRPVSLLKCWPGDQQERPVWPAFDWIKPRWARPAWASLVLTKNRPSWQYKRSWLACFPYTQSTCGCSFACLKSSWI